MISRLYFFLLFAVSVHAQTSTVHTVQNNGPRSERINIVFLSEGYTASDMPNFATHVNTAIDFLFTKEPWAQYRSYCNVFRIEVASNESGCDNGNTSGLNGLRDTYFNSGFNTAGVGQLLTLATGGSTKVYSLLNSHVPEYDVPVILVNDTKYGGAGGSFSVASVNASSAAVVEHEIGHSFANLADEYDAEYTAYTPAEKANNTAQTVRESIRWNHWIDVTTPIPTPETTTYDALAGLFEGSMYRISGWYRPHYNSLMKNLNRPCGQINREQFVLKYYNLVSTHDGYSPSATSSSVTTPSSLSFTITPKVPTSGPALQIAWKIDGVTQVGKTAASFTTLSDYLGDGVHSVTATLSDPTPFVRLDSSNLLKDDITWNITLTGQIPVTLANWRSTYGGDLVVLTGDRLPNLVKYALGLAANISATPAQTLSGTLTPISDQKYLTLTIPRRLRRSDVSYVVQVSSDLQTWNSGPGHTVTIEDSETQLTVRDATPSSSNTERFIRLAVQPLP